MHKLRHVLTCVNLAGLENCASTLRFLVRSSSSTRNYVEPTAVAYRAAMMQGIPVEDLPMRVNFRGKPYKPVSLEESVEYLSSPGKIVDSKFCLTVNLEYQELYRGKPVWFYFRRNYKGHFPPKYPRKSCTVGLIIVSI